MCPTELTLIRRKLSAVRLTSVPFYEDLFLSGLAEDSEILVLVSLSEVANSFEALAWGMVFWQLAVSLWYSALTLLQIQS